jgi:hypothetical protein
MATMKYAAALRLAFPTTVLALLLFATACTAGSTPGPLASHGVDYIPAFDTAYSGGGRG